MNIFIKPSKVSLQNPPGYSLLLNPFKVFKGYLGNLINAFFSDSGTVLPWLINRGLDG